MSLSPELTTGLVAICSAVVGALPGVVTSFLSRQADDKKQLRELVMKTTAENWRFIAENSASNTMPPFEHYMIHTAMMCDLAFSDKEITEQGTDAHLVRVGSVMQALAKHAASTPTTKRDA